MNRDDAFKFGCQTAALTHAHPSGYLSAGFLALATEEIVSGASLEDSIRTAKQCLITQPDHKEMLDAVEKAIARQIGWRNTKGRSTGPGLGNRGSPGNSPLLLSRRAQFRGSGCRAVNHSGDSDNKGAITGKSAERSMVWRLFRPVGLMLSNCVMRLPRLPMVLPGFSTTLLIWIAAR